MTASADDLAVMVAALQTQVAEITQRLDDQAPSHSSSGTRRS